MTHRNGIFHLFDSDSDQENQPLIPRRNPPVRVNHHIPYHGNCSDAIRDPIFWLFCSFAIAVILSLFLLIGAIWSWTPTVEKIESEGMYLYFFCNQYSFHRTAWNTQSVKFWFSLKPNQNLTLWVFQAV